MNKTESARSSPLADSRDEQELAAWMKAAQAGDRESYRLLLRRVEALVQGFVRNQLARAGAPDESAVSDIVQEILLGIHSKRATYDPAQFFLPWMYAIARYKTVDHLRARRSQALSVPIDEEWVSAQLRVEPGDPGASADVNELLASLPSKQREILRLVKLEGLSVEEASIRTGYSASDIKVSVHRAIQRLRKKLKETPNENG